MPNGSATLTGKDRSVWEAAHSAIDCYSSRRGPEIEFGGSDSLVSGQGAREEQVLLRFFKVRLDAESLFVMGNG